MSVCKEEKQDTLKFYSESLSEAPSGSKHDEENKYNQSGLGCLKTPNKTVPLLKMSLLFTNFETNHGSSFLISSSVFTKHLCS